MFNAIPPSDGYEKITDPQSALMWTLIIFIVGLAITAVIINHERKKGMHTLIKDRLVELITVDSIHIEGWCLSSGYGGFIIQDRSGTVKRWELEEISGTVHVVQAQEPNPFPPLNAKTIKRVTILNN